MNNLLLMGSALVNYISANSDVYIATLSIENQSGTGCYTATCTAPTNTPSLGSTTASGCKSSTVNITASCTTGTATWYSCPSNTCSNPASSSTACRVEYDDFSVFYNTAGTYK